MTTIPISALTPRRDHVEEVSWYFERAASEMGVSSNWGPLTARAQAPVQCSAQPGDRLTDQRLEAAQRVTVIHTVLRAMPPQLYAVLESRYESSRKHRPELLAVYGPFVGVALLTPAARRLGGVGKLCSAINKGDHRTVQSVRVQVEALWAEAFRVYADIRLRGVR